MQKMPWAAWTADRARLVADRLAHISGELNNRLVANKRLLQCSISANLESIMVAKLWPLKTFEGGLFQNIYENILFEHQKMSRLCEGI